MIVYVVCRGAERHVIGVSGSLELAHDMIRRRAFGPDDYTVEAFRMDGEYIGTEWLPDYPPKPAIETGNQTTTTPEKSVVGES